MAEERGRRQLDAVSKNETVRRREDWQALRAPLPTGQERPRRRGGPADALKHSFDAGRARGVDRSARVRPSILCSILTVRTVRRSPQNGG